MDDAAAGPDRDVTDRLTRFARSRDPRALWPRLSKADLVTARRRLEAVSRGVIAGHAAVRLDAGNEHEACALGAAAFMSGVGALIGRWIEDGRVQAAPAAAAIFAEHLDHGRRRAERIERGLIPVLDAMLARGVVPVVVKGFHTARAYAEEAGVRPMSDVDLVVQPSQIDSVEAAFREAAFLPTGPRTRPYKRDWMAAGVDRRVFSVDHVDARSPWRVEVHESLDRDFRARRFARLDSERDGVAPFVVAGRALLAPAQPLLLLTLACQISSELDVMRLMRVIDLVRVIKADRANGKLEWEAVLDAFRRTGVARYAFPGLALAEDLVPGTVDERVLQMAHGASTVASRYTVARLRPAATWTDQRDLMSLCMWADNPLEVGVTLGAAIARSVSRGPTAAFAVWRAMIRRALAGDLSLRPPDEQSAQPSAPGFPPLPSYSPSLTASE